MAAVQGKAKDLRLKRSSSLKIRDMLNDKFNVSL